MVEQTTSAYTGKVYPEGQLDAKDSTYKSGGYEKAVPFSQLLSKEYIENVKDQFQRLNNIPVKSMITEYQALDVYCDVHPFKDTMVWLKQPLASIEISDTYINASRIQSPFHEGNDHNLIIATQGPKFNTVDHFWRLVFQERVGKVVTLCEHIGDGGDCATYFPTKANPDVLSMNELKLELVSEEQKNAFLIERKFRLISNKGDAERSVSHYHFSGWPDWKLPVGDSREAYFDLIDMTSNYVSQNSKQDPATRERLLVHCRAGIGRTGTTIALTNALITLREQRDSGVTDPLISMYSIVRRLRLQRIWMVQMPNQYAFMFDFLKTNYDRILK